MSNTADYPAPYAYVNRVTKQSLRSLVLPLAALGAIWALSCSISLFQEEGVDQQQHQKRLSTFAIVLGSLYAVVTAMLLFGVIAAATRRLALIRLFSFMAVAVTVIVISSGLLRTIIHFMLKNALISECASRALGDDEISIWGVWSSNPEGDLSPGDLAQFCKQAWSHDSFGEILWLICEIIFMPLLTFVTFCYAQQESALASRGIPAQLPTNYTPAYGADTGYAADTESTIALPEMGYDYAPPPGSPPPFDKSLPAYSGKEMDKKDTDSMKTAVAEDPFADFEEHPRH